MDKEVLFKRKANLDTRVVDLDEGIELLVRALTSGEVRECRTKAKGNLTRYEHLLISAALVDPVMTETEVGQWLEGDPADTDDVGAPAGDAVMVMATIQELSGLAEGDATKSVPSVRKRQRR